MAVPAGRNGTTGKRGTGLLVTAGGYGVLFLLGAVQGMIGSFQYSRTAGSVPVTALACCAAILATCLLAAWAMRSVSGAVMPGMGWVVASFVLSMPVSSGSVIITSTAPGQWYLYGGTLSVAAGVIASFAGMALRAGRTGQAGVAGRSGTTGAAGTPGATGTPPR